MTNLTTSSIYCPTDTYSIQT